MMKQAFITYSTAAIAFAVFICGSLKAQQFIEPVVIKPARSGDNLTGGRFLTNANNTVIFRTTHNMGPNNYPDTLWLNGGDSTLNYPLIDKNTQWDRYVFSDPYFYFTSSDSETDLYKADINTGNTSLVKANAGEFFYPEKAGSNIFYWGRRQTYNSIDIDKKLYKTNGTSAGTSLVKDMNGNKNSFVSKMVSHNNNVYFLENDSTYCNLWRSDGTSAGTVVVANVYSNANNSFEKDPILVNGNIFFRVDYATYTMLWKYNIATGNKLAVKEIEDINGPWNEDRIDFQWTTMGNTLFFTGKIGNSKGLCKTDGTNAGTTLVKGFYESINNFTTIGAKLYFVNNDLYYDSYYDKYLGSRKLWVTEGTTATTIMLKDYPLFKSCDPLPRFLIPYKNKLCFIVSDSSIAGDDEDYLAFSDGTVSGTKKLHLTDLNAPRLPWENYKLLYNTQIDELFFTNGKLINKGIVCDNATLPKNNYSVTNSIQQDNSFNKPGTCDSLIALVWGNTNNVFSDSSRANVWVETAQPKGFVKRHYQITPLQPHFGTRGGRVTLYFTQAEFEAFNDAKNSPKLPVSPGSRIDRENVRIAWYSDTSNNNTGMPISYTGTVIIIDPEDEDIYYNSSIGAWQVSFDSPGFGGFVLQTQTTALAVIYSFTGNGNWSLASNWENNTIPPVPLPAASQIIINPIVKGKCVLDIPVTISPGSALKVATDKVFQINGNLNIQ